MATLIDAALRISRRFTPVYMGTATGTTTGSEHTTLIDTLNNEEQGYYDSGIIWLLSGNNIGQWSEVLSWGANTFTLKNSLTLHIAAGDKYAVIPNDLTRSDLRNAVNEACKSVSKILASNSTLVVVTAAEEYTLPSGVSDVRRVEVAEAATSPYGYEVNAYWEEKAGTLYFHPKHIPDVIAGNKIRLWYAAVHPDLDDTTVLYWDIDDIQWAAIIYLLQQEVITTNKDHEWVVELSRQAETENAKADRRIKRPPMRTIFMAGAWE